MRRNRYLLISALVLIIIALLVRERFVLDRARLTTDDEVVKEEFSLYKALHPKENALDEKIFTDAGEDVSDRVVTEKAPLLKNPLTPPVNPITAEAYVVGNLETGEIYMSQGKDSVFPIASISKLYTSLIARHVMDPEKKVEITEEALLGYGEAGHLVLGEKFSPEELLYPLVLESSNDAAEAFAFSYGYGQFLVEMNAFAQEIGMSKTFFRDASGISPGNISSAQDLFAFSRYLYSYEKSLLDITKTREYILATTTDHGSHRFVSINPLTRNEYFIGGKTGRTNEAGESMVSLFKYQFGDTTYPIAIIVLRSRFGEREADTGRLLSRFMTSIGKGM
ncbi:MAG: serine hydrolase [Patescibacteria group bacterium]